jgi:hypothetical protein
MAKQYSELDEILTSLQTYIMSWDPHVHDFPFTRFKRAKATIQALINKEKARAELRGRIDELKNWRARTLLTANDPLNIRVEMEARIKELEAQLASEVSNADH